MDVSQIKLGWIPDIPDQRDRMYSLVARKTLPLLADLRPQCPKVYNQLDVGSCVGNSTAGMFEFNEIKQGGWTLAFTPSRLFIYYNTRVMEGTVKTDAGCMIRDAIKSIAKQGVCPEKDWPYNPKKFASRPPLKCYTTALRHQSLTYQRLNSDMLQMRTILADGDTFVFGFAVFDSFMTDRVAKTGIMPIPKQNERLLGGHAVMAVGYDDRARMLIVRNSWGEEWGKKGYFLMPYDIASSKLCSDFWTIKTVEYPVNNRMC